MKNILVGYDGSKEAEWAFDFAVDLAKAYKANVHVLSVIWLLPEVTTDEIINNEKARVEGLLDGLKTRAKKRGLDVFTTTRVWGNPAKRIAEEIENDRADLLVIGHHSRGMLWRWMVGSVTDHIFDWAQCTVLVVKKDHCKVKV
jgi:nucleotide-binding universal stress UspA family protein